MNTEPIKVDPSPLFERLLEKSSLGRLKWEPTADSKAFVTSVGGEATFRIHLVKADAVDPEGKTTTIEVPRLDILDAEGHLLWDIGDVKGKTLWRIYEVARTSANRADERPVASRRRREGVRMDGREAFLKKLRRYPADRSLMRVGEGRKARDFWDLVRYVLDRR